MRLNIKTKLIGGFLITIALLLAMFSVAYLGYNSASKAEDTVFTRSQEDFYWAKMQGYINREVSYTLAYALTQKDSFVTNQLAQAALADETVKTLDTLVSDERRPIYDQIVTEKKAVDAVIEKLKTAYGSKDMVTGNALLTDLATVNNKLTADITSVNDSTHENVFAADAAMDDTTQSNTMIMIILAAAAVLVATGLGFWLSSSISNSIKKLNSALKAIAAGDLTRKISIKSKDELGTMADSYNEMQSQLNVLITQLKESATQLSSASYQLSTAASQSSSATQQVATSSQQMAKGAQEQSTNAQETAKAIEQLMTVITQLSRGSTEQSSGVQKAVASITDVAHTLTEVAGNANQAAEGAKQAAETAQSGAENAKQTLSGMDKIKASTGEVAKKIEELGSRSAEIGKIVAVIDDIAAQTNLLALNAAIEAARAGEQGRGFAVVSDEVRKLAERSATATKEIADLIGNIQKGVKEATEVMAGGNAAVTEGYNLAVKAGQSLEQIQKASSNVNNQIAQISVKAQQVNAATNELVKVIDSVGSVTEQNTAATEQMTASATQVSKAVETVAGIAEENSAATEEVSASAQEMSAQVEEIVASAQTLKDMAATLEESVAMFKVEADQNGGSGTNTGDNLTIGTTQQANQEQVAKS